MADLLSRRAFAKLIAVFGGSVSVLASGAGPAPVLPVSESVSAARSEPMHVTESYSDSYSCSISPSWGGQSEDEE